MNPRTTRRLVPAVILAILASIGTVAAPLSAFAATPPACPQVGTTVTCTYLTGDNLFAVPAGVTSLHVVAIGGRGGQNGFGVEGNTNSYAGHGAVVTADVAASPGTSVHAIVGGNGHISGHDIPSGGANGGGAGNINFSQCQSGGGGGASDIRLDSTLASRILVAGGGGGAGCDGRASFNGQTYAGTAFGGDAGADGTPRPPTDSTYSWAGQAGCPIGVTVDCGTGGTVGTLAGETFHGTAGEDGALGLGGSSPFGYSSSGGGGGGGYFGGGAGGSSGCLPAPLGGCLLITGAGGGGGSSLVPPGGTLALDATGVPKVEISYAAPALPAGAHAQLAPATVDFGDVVVGQPAAQQLVTLTSTGVGDLSVSSIAIASPADGFAVNGSDCGTVLPSQWSCQITVEFATQTVGAHSATLQITDDASDSPQTVTLTANGTGGSGALVSVSPGSLDFGNDGVGETSAPQLVTLTNVGTIAIFVNSLILLPASGFAATDDCLAPIAPGDTCRASVTFTPSSLGSVSGQLAILGAQNNPVVTLAGNGVPAVPAAQLDKASLAFGNVAVGAASAIQTVTLSNTGTGPLAVSTVSVVGTNPGDFRETSDACSAASLAPGSTCSVSIAFAPTVRGARAATLRFADNAVGSPQDVALSGAGVTPAASISPTSMDFGMVSVGTTSTSQVVTITNTGDVGQTLTFTSAVISGTNAGEFAITSDGCVAAGAVLAKDAHCQIAISFTPGAAGARSATLAIGDNAGDSPQSVSLSGTGGIPSADLAVSISASPNPVRSGQKVTYTITVYNAGPSSATGILVNDSLSSQSTFVSATMSGGACVTPVKGASGVVSCSLASLTSGSSKPIQIVVTVIAKKNSITNTVTVSAVTADPNLANNTASITTRVK